MSRKKNGGFGKVLEFIGLVDDGDARDTYVDEYASDNYGRQQPYGPQRSRVQEALEKIDKMFDGEVVLTVEPHLFVSDSYKKFAGKELKHKFVFETSDEAFDYAVNTLKKLLAEIGHPVENGIG